jgi:AraC-like DNA-binding protein
MLHSHVTHLFLLAVVKWLIAFILLFYNRNRNNSNYLLAAGLLLMSLFDINHYLAVSGVSQLLTAVVYLYSSPFVLLIGPCFYLYVRNTMADRNILRRMDWLHTIPFWLMWINHLPYFTRSLEYQFAFAGKIHADLNQVREPAHYLLLQHYPLNMLRGVIGLGYFIACIWRIYRYVKRMPNHPEVPRRQSLITLRWIGFLTGTLTVVSITFLFMTHELRNQPLSATHYQQSGFFYALLSCYGILSLSLLFFPEILYGLPRAGSAPVIVRHTFTESPTPTPHVHQDEEATTAGTALIHSDKDSDADPFTQLAGKIIEHLEQEKPYLRIAFSVTDLSLHFGVPRHHIDYCFAKIIGEKFTEMRKRLRVEHAKILLPEHRNMSLEGVGKNAGFASKSSFFSSFREVTGMTPAEYIKSLEDRG